MRARQSARILLCGLVAGTVWYALSTFLHSLLAPDFVALVDEGGVHRRFGGAAFYAVELFTGVWAMWLYSVLAPRLGPGLKSAATAALGLWTLKTLQSAKWVGLGFAPVGVVTVPLATSLLAIGAGTVAGAWLYERVEVSR